MITNFKSLFVKTGSPEPVEKIARERSFSFPAGSPVRFPQVAPLPVAISDDVLAEVLQVYEEGLESVNLPGYDFYEYYQAISATGNATPQVYTLAYRMARTLDRTITPQKLIESAGFYLHKLEEVHRHYVAQGQGKLTALGEEKQAEQAGLTAGIEGATGRIAQLEAELAGLRLDVAEKQDRLSTLDAEYAPRESAIREKIGANAQAYQISTDKLTAVREGIRQYIQE